MCSEDEFIKVGVLAVSNEKFLEFLLRLAIWAQDIVENLKGKLRVYLVVEISTIYMTACERTSNISIERKTVQKAEDNTETLLPSAMPGELFKPWQI